MDESSTLTNLQASAQNQSQDAELVNKFTNLINETVEITIRCMKGNGIGYLLNRYPVITNNIPKQCLDSFTEKNSMACANDNGVYFSVEHTVKSLMGYFGEQFIRDVVDEPYCINEKHGEVTGIVRDILYHEYGHILNGHMYMTEPKDEHEKKILSYTNEIEANRVVRLFIFNPTNWFNSVAIDDQRDEYKQVQSCISHQAVYNKVKEILDKEKQDNKGGKGGQNNDNKSNGNQDNNGINGPKPNFGDLAFSTSTAGKEHTKEEALDKLSAEIGLEPSKEFTDDKNDTKSRVRYMKDKFDSQLIKKSIERIKSALRGDLSRGNISTYSRQSRHSYEDSLMRKGVKKGDNNSPRVLVALDASGSMDAVAVQTAATAIKVVMETLGRKNRKNVFICTFNYSIRKKGTADKWQEIVNSYRASGGTNFNDVVDLAIENSCDVVLCVGDGCAGIDEKGYYWCRNKDKDVKLPRWIDLLIEGCPNQIDYVKQHYYSDKQKNGTDKIVRETLWLGDDSEKIQKALRMYE